MKKTFTLLLAFCALVQGFAIQPRRVLFPVTQSDGTTIMVYKNGDGRLAFYSSQDGLTLLPGANGDLCYARLEAGKIVPTDVVAHEASARTASELSFVSTSVLRVSDPAAIRAQERRVNTKRPKAIEASTADGLGKYGQSGAGAVNSIGEYTIPVLMVQFSDQKFKSTTTVAKMTRFYNTEGYKEESKCVGSVRDYFKSQSRGLFVPTFEIVGTVTLPQKTSYYGGNVTDRSSEWYGYDKGLCDDNYFVVDAIELAAKQGIDFSKYVVNGGVPLISILYAGPGEATESYGGENYIWPCEWDIDQTIAGVHFNSFFVGNELDSDRSLMGMGVFCHEFGHALGLPDFYVTDYSYTDTEPVGEWSIMDSGAYVQDSRAPMGYTAYERSYLGWLDIPELGTDAKTVTLDSYDVEGGTPAVLVRNPSSSKEYFIYENHQPGTWYPSSYGSGMLVMRIAYDKTAWEWNNLNNTKSKQRIKLITANGKNPSTSGSTSSELYSYNGKAVDVATWPLYNGNNLSKPFYAITNKDGKVTFNYLQKDISTHVAGDVIADETAAYQFVTPTTLIVTAKEGESYSGDVVIPSTITEDGTNYSVVGIAEGAFANNSELTSIVIPRTVTSIGEGAFAATPALTSITVEEGNRNYRSEDGVLETKYVATAALPRPTVKDVADGVVTFDFAANPWNLPVSSSSDAKGGEIKEPIVEGGVTMTATNGTTVTRLWKGASAIDLRVYKSGGSLTFTAAEGQTITAINVTASKWNMTASEGEMTGNSWTGEAQSVTFTAGGTCQISKVEITLEGAGVAANWEIFHFPAARTGSYVTSDQVASIRARAFEDASVEEVTLSEPIVRLGEAALSTPSLTKLTVLGTNPDICAADPFEKVDKQHCQLIVPEEAEEAFKASEYWKGFFVNTGISAVSSSATASEVFDLQGRRVMRPAKGVYILGGKKTIVK